MSSPLPDAEFIEDLYKYAWLLVQRQDLAEKVVLDACEEIFASSSTMHDDTERIHAKLLQAIRLRALKVPMEKPNHVAISPGAGWPVGAVEILESSPPNRVQAAIHGVDEPARSAYILLTLDLIEVESVERILGVNLAQLADLMDQARFSIAANLERRAEHNDA